jgi:hypothetical protein
MYCGLHTPLLLRVRRKSNPRNANFSPFVLDVGESSIPRGLFRPLQRSVHLGEVEITEQRRDHSPYTKGNIQFERIVKGWRAKYSMVDLRLKK